MEIVRNAYKMLVRKPEVKIPLAFGIVGIIILKHILKKWV
jgi:hypothetical protein